MQNTSVMSSSSPISQISEFLRTFGWAGKSPAGTWASPHTAISQANGYDLDHVGAFTLNEAAESHSGQQQVAKLLALPYAAIPSNTTLSYAGVFAYMHKQGFKLPDLRAAEYMCAHKESLRSENPKLFEAIEAYLDEKMLISAPLIFAGSTIRSNVGLTDFPCLYWNGVNKCLGKTRDGRCLSSRIHVEDIFLFIGA